jgi:amino acid transporter
VKAFEAPAGTFTRMSSGLVRQVGTLDTLYYCIMQIAICFVFFNISIWAFYPGASLELATIIATIGSVALGIVYALYAAVYPRSGGEYVFLSRTMHPALGFMFSFSMAFWQAAYIGINGAFTAKFALSPIFQTLGFQLGNQTLTDIGDWLAGSWGIFLFGTFVVVFFGYVLYRGMRTYFSIQRWCLAVAAVSIGLSLVVLLLGALGVFNFQANLDALVGAGTYDQTIAAGQAAGADLSTNVTLQGTWAFLLWPAFSLVYAMLSVSFSGEIRDVRRGQLIGIVGGVIVAGIIMVLYQGLSVLAFGGEFLKAASYLYTTGDPAYALPSAYVGLYAGVLAGNPALTVLIDLWFPILTFFIGATVAIYASRAVFAWGIDGMVPEKLAEVGERHHSPHYSILLVCVIGEVMLLTYAFTDWIAILSSHAGQTAVFVAMAVAGIYFPYRYRKLYLSSPAKFDIGGVAVMSIAAVIALVFTGSILYQLLTDSTFGANTPLSVTMFFVVLATGFVYFWVARWYRMRQGVNVDLRYKEIPIE